MANMSTANPEASLIECDADEDVIFAKRGCCFWMPCFGSDISSPSSNGSSWWEHMRAPENKDQWWSRSWMKLREWSELMAGPKWKTFIRRFNKGRAGAYTRQNTYQYDPSSYALNFDEGNGKDEEDYFMEFSTRYASIPASAKSSMDLGKDGPTFT